MTTTSARISRNSSATRRRRWTNCIRAPGWEDRVVVRWATSPSRRRGRGLMGGQPLHGALGVGQAAGADAVLDRPGGVGVEPGDLDVAGLVGVREVDAREVGLDAAEDRDDAVLLTDVVLVLAPAPGRGAGHPGDTEDPERGQQAA